MSTTISSVNLSAKGEFNLSVNGISEVEKMIKALRSLHSIVSNNSPTLKYWGSQTEMIKNAQTAFDKYTASLKAGSQFTPQHAVELVNTVNALKSIYKDFDLSSINSQFNQLFGEAEKSIQGMKGLIDPAQFKSTFSIISESIRDLGTQFEGVDARFESAADLAKRLFENANVDTLVSNLKEMEAELTETQNSLEDVTSKYNALNKVDVENLRNKLSDLRSELEIIGETNLEEFLSKLHSMNLITSSQKSTLEFGGDINTWNDAIGDYDNFLISLNDLADKLRSNKISVSDAMAELKQSYKEMFSGLSQDVDLSSLEHVEQIVKETVNSLQSSQQTYNSNGINAITSVMSSLSTDVSGLDTDGITSFFNALKQSLENISGDKIDSIQRLFQILKTDISVDSNSLVKVGDGLRAMTQDLDSSVLTVLKNLNFAGLNELKVSKASLSNLATYLPVISNDVNIDNLEKLSQLNFDNLSNLKISKDKMVGLATLADQPNTSSITATLNDMAAKVDDIYDQMEESARSASQTIRQTNEQIINSLNKRLSDTWKNVSTSGQDQYLGTYSSIQDRIMKFSEMIGDMKGSDIATTIGVISNEIKDLANLTGIDKNFGNLDQRFVRIGDEANKASKSMSDLQTKLKGIESVLAKNQNTSFAGKISEIRDIYDSTMAALSSDQGMLTSEFNNALDQMTSKVGELNNEIKQLGYDNNLDQSILTYSDEVHSAIQKLINDYKELRDKASSLGQTDTASDIDSIINGLEQWDSELRSNSTRTSDYTKRMTSELEKYKSTLQDVRSVGDISTLAGNPAQLQKATDDVNKLRSSVQDMLTQWTQARGTAPYQALQQLDAEIVELQRNMSSMSMEEFNRKLSELKLRSSQAAEEIKQAGTAAQSFGSKISSAIKSYMSMFTGTMAIMRVVQGIKQAVSATIELDAAMTQLQIVTKASDAQLASYADNIVDVANKTAASVSGTIDAITTYSRLGYSLQESTIFSKYTTMLANVGAVDISSAQDSVTAIIKAFDFDVDDIESVMDKLVTVGNNFPISVSDLALGINNASSMLAVAGNSFDESLALLTASNVTVQNISKASTGLRTIAARIRNTTTELDDLGEAMTSAQYDELVSALTDARVALVDENNEFRSTYDILKDLASVWDDLTSMQQAAISKTLAGTRQQNVLSSILTQFKEAENAMTRMADSEGELSKANDVYLDSVQAHIQQLKNAFETMLYSDTVTDFAKQIVDFGTSLIKLVSVVGDAVDALGGLPTVFTAIAGALLVFKGASILDKFTTSLSSLIQAVVAHPVLAAVAAIATALVGIVTAVHRAHEQMLKDARDSASDLSKNLDSVDEYQARARELRTELDAGNLSEGEARVKREELLQIEDKICEALGEEAGAFQLVTGSIKDNIDAIDNLQAVQFDDWKNKNMGAISEITDEYSDYNPQLFSGLGSWQIRVPTVDELWENGYEGTIVDFYKRLEAAFKEAGYDNINIVDHLSDIGDNGGFINGLDLNITDIYSYQDTYSDLLRIISDVTGELIHSKDDVAKALRYVSEYYNQATKDSEDFLEDNSELIDTYAKGMLSFENEYKSAWQSYVENERELRKAQTENDEELMATSFDNIREMQDKLIELATENNDPLLLTWLRHNFSVENIKNEPIEVPLDLKLNLKQEIDSGNLNVEDTVLNTLKEGGLLNDQGALNMDLVTQIQDLESRGEVPASLQEAVAAYDQIAEAAQNYNYVLEDGTADVEGFLNALVELKAIGKIADNTVREIKPLQEILDTLHKYSKNGAVNLMLRPEVDTSALRAAGYDVEDGDFTRAFAQSFSDEENKVAINLTPVLTDAQGNYVGILSKSELNAYAQKILDGGEDDLKLQIGSEIKMDNALEEAQKVLKVINESSSDFFIRYNGDKYSTLISDLYSVAGASDTASAALDRLNKALSKDDPTSGLEARLKNYQEMVDLAEKGMTGHPYFQARAEYFGIGDLSEEDQLKWLEEYAYLFGRTMGEDGKYTYDAAQGLRNFLDTVSDGQEEVAYFKDGIEHVYGELIKIDKETGQFSFDPSILFNEDKMDLITKKFGLTKEFLIDMLNYASVYDRDFQWFGPETFKGDLLDAGLIEESSDAFIIYEDRIRNVLKAAGLADSAIDELIAQTSQLSDNTVSLEIDNAGNWLQQLADANIDPDQYAQIIANALSGLSPEVQAEIIPKITNDKELQNEVQQIIDEQDVTAEVPTTTETTETKTEAESLKEAGDSVKSDITDAAKAVEEAGTKAGKAIAELVTKAINGLFGGGSNNGQPEGANAVGSSNGNEPSGYQYGATELKNQVDGNIDLINEELEEGFEVKFTSNIGEITTQFLGNMLVIKASVGTESNPITIQVDKTQIEDAAAAIGSGEDSNGLITALVNLEGETYTIQVDDKALTDSESLVKTITEQLSGSLGAAGITVDDQTKKDISALAVELAAIFVAANTPSTLEVGAEAKEEEFKNTNAKIDETRENAEKGAVMQVTTSYNGEYATTIPDQIRKGANEGLIPISPETAENVATVLEAYLKKEPISIPLTADDEELQQFQTDLQNGISPDGMFWDERWNQYIVDSIAYAAQSRMQELGNQYNALINGNVDYNKRPHVSPEAMWAAGYTEFPSDDVATTYSMGYTEQTAEYPITFEITPIMEDGTVLTPEQVKKYISSLDLTGGIDEFLASDAEKHNLILNVVEGEYDKEYWNNLNDNLDEIKQESEGIYKDFIGYDWEITGDAQPLEDTVEDAVTSAESETVNIPVTLDKSEEEAQIAEVQAEVSEPVVVPMTTSIADDITAVLGAKAQGIDPVTIPVQADTTEFVQSLANGEIRLPDGVGQEVVDSFVNAFAEAGLIELPEVDTTNLENASDAAGDVADSLGEVSNVSLDETANAAQLDTLASSAGTTAQNLDAVATGKQALSDNPLDLSGDSSQLLALSGASGGAAINVGSVATAESDLQNTPFSLSGQVAQLSSVATAATNATIQIQNLSTAIASMPSGGGMQQAATGTKSAKGGLTLLGDEYSPDGSAKPELVVSHGEAYLAGINGPTLANLKRGDVVYPYRETKKILASNKFSGSLSGKIPAFSGENDSSYGTKYGGGNLSNLYEKTKPSSGNGSQNITYNDYSTSYDVEVDSSAAASISGFTALIKSEEFKKFVDDFLNGTEKLQEAYDNLADDKDTGEIFDNLYDYFKEDAEALAILGERYDFTSDKVKQLNDLLQQRVTDNFNAQFGKLSTEEDIQALKDYMATILEMGEVTETIINLDTFSEKISKMYSAIKESVDATGLTADSIAELQERYKNLEGFDPNILFEKTANGIHLNTSAMRDLEGAYQKFYKNKINKQLQDLQKEYDRLTDEIENCTDEMEDTSKADLYAQRDQIQEQIGDVEMLASQYDGLTSVFEKWQQAQSMGEEGDMYDSLANSLEDINELFEQGLIGTNKFRSAVQLMTNMDISDWSAYDIADLYEDQIKTIKKYFTEGSEGVEAFLNDVKNLNSEWANFDSEGWHLEFDNDEVANALGINVETVEALLRKLSDYGFEMHFDVDGSEDFSANASAATDDISDSAGDISSSADDISKGATTLNRAADNMDSAAYDLRSSADALQDAADALSSSKSSGGSGSSKSNTSSDDEESDESEETEEETQKQIKDSAEDLSDAAESLEDAAESLEEATDTSSGDAAVRGTAWLQGSAFAGGTRGDWGAHGSGEALGGELGPEILVRNGKWHLIGQNGAEFFDYRPNDIIFNAEQTKQLLENGKLDSGNRRGRAFAYGTATPMGLAFAGKLNKTTGEGYIKIPTSSGSKDKDDDDNGKSGKSSREEKSAKQKIDWIEIAISRIERIIEGFTTVASDSFETLKTRLQASSDAIKKIANRSKTYSKKGELQLQEEGARRYRKEANKVGLSKALQKKVQNGTIDINEYSDKTREKIEEYQKWYEKMLQCQDAATELRTRLKELYKERFDNIQNDFENRLEVYESKIEALDGSGFKTLKRNNSNLTKTIKNYKKELKLLKTEAKDLQKALNDAVRNGKIKKRSEEWYAMRQVIADVKQSIRDVNESISEAYQEKFQNIEAKYSALLDAYEDQIKMLDNNSYAATEQNNNNAIASIGLYRNELTLLGKELNSLTKARDKALKSGAIKKGTEAWYEMEDAIRDVQQSIQDVHRSIAGTYEEIFENLENEYGHFTNTMSKLTSQLNTAMETATERGYAASTKYYDGLMKVESENVQILQKELAELKKALVDGMASGEIQKYSESWWSMQDAIDGVESSIADSNLQLIKYANSMRDIEWGNFDKTQKYISQITDEAGFLIDLLEDSKLYNDNGSFTSNGMTTLGLRVQNYDVATAQANKYAQEIKRLNKEIASDPYNEKLIDRREELLKLQRESILAAESEKQAVKSLVQEGINTELSSLRELIDAYTEGLSNTKAMNDYQKNIEEQAKNISNLRKQLSAYSGDTSEENRARVQRLQVDLSEAEAELAETEYEHFIDDATKLLDNLYDDYDELLNQRLDNVDALMADMIDTANKNATDISSTIMSSVAGVGYTLMTGLDSIWQLVKDKTTNIDGAVNLAATAADLSVLSGVNHSDSIAQQVEKGLGTTLAEVGKAAGVSGSGFDASKISNSTIKGILDSMSYFAYANVAKSAQPDLSAFNGAIANKAVTNSTVGDINITIGNVTNYDDFVSQLSKDNQFQKYIQSLTTGQLAGGSKLLKYNYF